MNPEQAVDIIMGANIGTAITDQITVLIICAYTPLARLSPFAANVSSLVQQKTHRLASKAADVFYIISQINP